MRIIRIIRIQEGERGSGFWVYMKMGMKAHKRFCAFIPIFTIT
jgi:hypothetical protein